FPSFLVTVTSSDGVLKPYAERSEALSSIVLSAESEESCDVSELAASESAARVCGEVSCHLPFSRLSVSTSPVPCLIVICATWSSGMATILGDVSVGFLAAVACFLFDHQTAPPRTAKRTTAIRSPFGFMAYLLFHHVARPNPTTPSGKITILIQNSEFSRCGVMLICWSSGCLGRIEIRSSSLLSQLTVFTNRSRLPRCRDPTRLLVAHSDVPNTANRPCGVPEYVPTAAMVSGPFLPLFASTCPSGEIEVTATLSSPVARSFVTFVLSALLMSIERVSGNAVGTRLRGDTIGCVSYCRISGTSGPNPKICPTPLRSSTRSLFTVTPQPASTFARSGCSLAGSERPIFRTLSSMISRRP